MSERSTPGQEPPQRRPLYQTFDVPLLGLRGERERERRGIGREIGIERGIDRRERERERESGESERE